METHQKSLNSLMDPGSDTPRPIRKFPGNFLMGSLFQLHLENLRTATRESILSGWTH